MAQGSTGYLQAARHPWSCVLFVAPLLLAYEGGLMLGERTPEFRNGAETWLRDTLAALGFSANLAPILLVGILLAWSLLRRGDRPSDYFGTWTGMLVESGLFGLCLYVLSQAFLPLADKLDMYLQLPRATEATPIDPSLDRVVGYLGAGIYEETLFRLVLFSVLCWTFLLADFPGFFALNLAACGSALIFAGAHHLGPSAEPFQPSIFLFRSIAGLYFAWLFRLRGFGVTVGAHTGYDLLVGVLIPTT